MCILQKRLLDSWQWCVWYSLMTKLRALPNVWWWLLLYKIWGKLTLLLLLVSWKSTGCDVWGLVQRRSFFSIPYMFEQLSSLRMEALIFVLQLLGVAPQDRNMGERVQHFDRVWEWVSLLPRFLEVEGTVQMVVCNLWTLLKKLKAKEVILIFNIISVK